MFKIKIFGISLVLLICYNQLGFCEDNLDYDGIFGEEDCAPVEDEAIDLAIDDIFKEPTIGCDESEKCVPYYLCSNGNIKRDGAFIINARFGGIGGKVGSKNPCPSLQMCCRKTNYIPKRHITTTVKPRTTTTRNCIPLVPTSKPSTPRSVVTSKPIDPTTNKPEVTTTTTTRRTTTRRTTTTTTTTVKPVPYSCGKRFEDGIGGKVHGEDNEAQFGEFPWMVGIFEKPRGRDIKVYHCGGSLINLKVVLSDAHTITNMNKARMYARAGEWEMKSEDEMYEHQDIPVKDVVIHENFDVQYNLNDLSLLFLNEAFVSAPHIGTVCLAPIRAKYNRNLCFSSGWGKTDLKQKSYSKFLKKAELPIVSKRSCERTLQTTDHGEEFRLHEGFLCAGGEKDIDMCKGDGGSPLVCEMNEKPGYFYQVGIVSWGVGCGVEEIPGVYIDVSKYKKWIDQQVSKKGISVDEYSF